MDWQTENFKIPMWTVYSNPKDYPGKYVVRLFDLTHPTSQHVIVDTLFDARSTIPPHLFCLQEHNPDEPQIVEVWF